jgi:hypothetical protein
MRDQVFRDLMAASYVAGIGELRQRFVAAKQEG